MFIFSNTVCPDLYIRSTAYEALQWSYTFVLSRPFIICPSRLVSASPLLPAGYRELRKRCRFYGLYPSLWPPVWSVNYARGDEEGSVLERTTELLHPAVSACQWLVRSRGSATGLKHSRFSLSSQCSELLYSLVMKTSDSSLAKIGLLFFTVGTGCKRQFLFNKYE